MQEPVRLIDDTDNELEAKLLRAARSYRASRSTRFGTLAALGIAGSTATLAKSSAAAATLWSIKGWVAAGVVASGAVVGVATLAISDPEPTSSPAEVQVAVQPPPKTQPALPRAPSPASESAPAEPEPAKASGPRHAPPRPSGVKSTPSRSSLADELAALDAARAALQAGDAPSALRHLNDHAREFPRGRLQLEAEVLRIEALARTGNRAASASRARRFLERHPNSVLAPRLRRYAGE
jgi:TolA-binding protein